MADPAQLQDVIGEDGFTVILVLTRPGNTELDHTTCEVVATCSVKDFGNGDVEAYAEWSKNRSGTEWAQTTQSQERNASGTEQQSQNAADKLEVTAFAVSPQHQALGLGARLLKEVRWLVTGRRFRSVAANVGPMVQGLQLCDAANTIAIQGIDLNGLQQHSMTKPEGTRSDQPQQDSSPRLVLMAIRELGNETYYCKRGFRTVWSGPVPVGMWDCRKECTMVYMEMEID